MIQIRKDLYVEKLKQLKNIRVEEKLRCVFKKEIVSDNEVINYTFSTVNIPTNDQKKQIKYKFVNTSSIETQLKHSTEYFIDGIEQYIENGSNFKLDSILGMKCYIDAYKPLRGSSYVDLPSYIENKKAIINAKHKDSTCFIKSLCSALHHNEIAKNHERENAYTPFIDKYMKFAEKIGLEFPVKIDETIIKKFEKEFNMSINIYSFDYNETFTRYPLHISDNQKDKHINLLYYSDIEETKYHYAWIKNFNRLMSDITKNEK